MAVTSMASRVPRQIRKALAPLRAFASEAPTSKPEPELVLEKDFFSQFTLLTLPTRNFLRSLRLRPLNLVFSRQVWDEAAFAAEAEGVFREMFAAQQSGDVAALRARLPETLVEELQADASSTKEAWARRELVEVKALGVYTTRLWPDEKNHLSLWVTQVFRTLEEYTPHEASDEASGTFRVERLQRWTFRRQLQNDHTEEVTDWQLVALDKGCWRRSADGERTMTYMVDVKQQVSNYSYLKNLSMGNTKCKMDPPQFILNHTQYKCVFWWTETKAPEIIATMDTVNCPDCILLVPSPREFPKSHLSLQYQTQKKRVFKSDEVWSRDFLYGEYHTVPFQEGHPGSGARD
ncbi:unnamed protein product [Effrenium voratum]|nr:unnamed protein product [Effrenium voratum]